MVVPQGLDGKGVYLDYWSGFPSDPQYYYTVEHYNNHNNNQANISIKI